MQKINVVIVGVGGIGGWLVNPVGALLSTIPSSYSRLTLIDGDHYERKNISRQFLAGDGIGESKSFKHASFVRERYPNVYVINYDDYLTEDNAVSLIPNDSIVISCVDNHATRRILSLHCTTLKNVVLISAGNDEWDGNVQTYVRLKGRDLSPPITARHPEIEHPVDLSPSAMSCEQRIAHGSTQTLAANFMAASLVLSAFVGILNSPPGWYEEVYFDTRRSATRSINHYERKNLK